MILKLPFEKYGLEKYFFFVTLTLISRSAFLKKKRALFHISFFVYCNCWSEEKC